MQPNCKSYFKNKKWHYSVSMIISRTTFLHDVKQIGKIARIFRFTVIQDISDYSVNNSINASGIDKFPEWFNLLLQFLQIYLQRIIGFYTGSIRFIVFSKG